MYIHDENKELSWADHNQQSDMYLHWCVTVHLTIFTLLVNCCWSLLWATSGEKGQILGMDLHNDKNEFCKTNDFQLSTFLLLMYQTLYSLTLHYSFTPIDWRLDLCWGTKNVSTIRHIHKFYKGVRLWWSLSTIYPSCISGDVPQYTFTKLRWPVPC